MSLVLVTYRNGEQVRACLQALPAALAGLSAEVLVVDNASGDATPDIVRGAAPWAQVLQAGHNHGFAGGCRLAAARVRGDYLVFCNPDAVPLPGAVAQLVACAERHREAAVVGGRHLDQAGAADPRSWWRRPTLWSLFCFATGMSTVFPGNRLFDPESAERWEGDEREVPAVSGAFMLVRRADWVALGGFDESFFMYGEDVDLCLRAAERGRSVWVAPNANVAHVGGGSSSASRRKVLLLTGRVTLARRHLPPGTRGLGVRLLVLGVGLRAALAALGGRVHPDRQGRPTTAASVWRAVWCVRKEWKRGWVGV